MDDKSVSKTIDILKNGRNMDCVVLMCKYISGRVICIPQSTISQLVVL